MKFYKFNLVKSVTHINRRKTNQNKLGLLKLAEQLGRDTGRTWPLVPDEFDPGGSFCHSGRY